jgi:NAD(P)-dependent dehydrogenase (short-subunit alcohol dehydrogenase family)
MTLSRVALVTGASSGFGQATAALLAAQGFQVFGTSRTPAHNTTGSFEPLPLDVDLEASVQTCIQKILERTGRIDLLVNNELNTAEQSYWPASVRHAKTSTRHSHERYACASFRSRSAFRWLIFSLSAGLMDALSRNSRPCSFVL